MVYYSQTGQLGQILTQFCDPLKGHNLEFVEIKPTVPYDFPWDVNKFFATMPSAVLEKGMPLQDFKFALDRYDLIVFGYQPWFLSPSTPATAILNHSQFQNICADTPVITIIGARNMWINAQEMVKRQLKKANANLVGNIALVDKSNNLASAVGIVYWLIYGKKESLWGIFPKPGISENDIIGMTKFGELTQNQLTRGGWNGFQDKIVALKGVIIKTNILFIEGRAPKLFQLWANAIDTKRNKKLWVRLFKYYLFAALFVLSPIVLSIYNLFFVPLTRKAIKRKKDYFLGVNV